MSGYDRNALQLGVDAIVAAGATGVLAEVQTAAGVTVARGGVADLATRAPMPWNAYYRISDDTKTFTATVVLQLVDEGRLALTDTVEKWLPGVVRGNGNDGDRITVANLLRQTSGLREYDKQLPMAADITPGGYRRERFHAFRPRELVHLATRQPPHWVPDASDPAGETRFIPANTNYALAGMLVEQVTGHSWERETHERVIEPLGLRHTLTPGTCAYLPQPSATAYTRFPGAEALTDTSIIVPPGPDRGIISTTSDLNTFFRALLGGRLLSADRMAQMRETVEATAWARTWPGVRYGLGLAWRPLEGRDAGIWFHGGTMPGTVSQGGVSADGGRSVATLTSTYTFGTEQDAVDEAITTLVDRALSTPE